MSCPMGAFRHQCCNEADALRAEVARLRESYRVEELESHWKDFMTWDESAVMYDWKKRAETAEAERDEARAEVKDLEQAQAQEIDAANRRATAQGEAHATLLDEIARLRQRVEELERALAAEPSLTELARLYKQQDVAEAEVARLEGLILDWDTHYDLPEHYGLKDEARRIRAAKGE